MERFVKKMTSVRFRFLGNAKANGYIFQLYFVGQLSNYFALMRYRT